MYLLLKDPSQRDLLKNNPELITSAIEEVLRYEPSVPRAWRLAKDTINIGGQTIDKGALVFPILSAAKRDPSYFPNPDNFDIQRSNKNQLAFGYGIQRATGSWMAWPAFGVSMLVMADRKSRMRFALK